MFIKLVYSQNNNTITPAPMGRPWLSKRPHWLSKPCFTFGWDTVLAHCSPTCSLIAVRRGTRGGAEKYVNILFYKIIISVTKNNVKCKWECFRSCYWGCFLLFLKDVCFLNVIYQMYVFGCFGHVITHDLKYIANGKHTSGKTLLT
ncbi:hypothetical protein HanPSC8_Chr11g0497001 [Helianthus annuus]|nr:hypothetical protein HanPSC8_Chr11g0497001 [Helianthus annuus]